MQKEKETFFVTGFFNRDHRSLRRTLIRSVILSTT